MRIEGTVETHVLFCKKRNLKTTLEMNPNLVKAVWRYGEILALAHPGPKSCPTTASQGLAGNSPRGFGRAWMMTPGLGRLFTWSTIGILQRNHTFLSLAARIRMNRPSSSS